MAAAEEDAREKRQRYDAARAVLAAMLHRIDLVRRFELQRALLDSAAAHARFFGAGVGEMAMMEPFFGAVARSVDLAAQQAAEAQNAVLWQAQPAAAAAAGTAAAGEGGYPAGPNGPASTNSMHHRASSASALALASGPASASAHIPSHHHHHTTSSSLGSALRAAFRSSSTTSLHGLAAGSQTTPSHSRKGSADISDTGSGDVLSVGSADPGPLPQLQMQPQAPPSWVPPVGAGAVSDEDKQRAVGAMMAQTVRTGKKGVIHCGYLLKQSHSVINQTWNVRWAGGESKTRPRLFAPCLARAAE